MLRLKTSALKSLCLLFVTATATLASPHRHRTDSLAYKGVVSDMTDADSNCPCDQQMVDGECQPLNCPTIAVCDPVCTSTDASGNEGSHQGDDHHINIRNTVCRFNNDESCHKCATTSCQYKFGNIWGSGFPCINLEGDQTFGEDMEFQATDAQGRGKSITFKAYGTQETIDFCNSDDYEMSQMSCGIDKVAMIVSPKTCTHCQIVRCVDIEHMDKYTTWNPQGVDITGKREKSKSKNSVKPGTHMIVNNNTTPSNPTNSFLDLCTPESDYVQCNGTEAVAVINSNETTFISNCLFFSCPQVVIQTDAIFTNVRFTDSSSTGDGGAIFINPGASVSLIEVAFSHCAATGNGGAIFNMGGSLSLSDVTFYGSLSYEGSGSDIAVNQTGSLAWNGGSSNGLGDSIFERNQSLFGGSMWLKDASTATVSNVQFMGQRVRGLTTDGEGWGGGVLYSEGDNVEIRFENVKTNDTFSGSVGGIVDLRGGSFTCELCHFSNSIASPRTDGPFALGYNGGGAIQAEDALQISIRNSVFYNVSTGGCGGAIALTRESAATFENVIFDTCSSGDAGGAVASIYDVTTFSNVLARNCHSDTRGGAFFIQSGEVTFDKVVTYGNTAGGNDTSDGYVNSYLNEVGYASVIHGFTNVGSVAGGFYITNMTYCETITEIFEGSYSSLFCTGANYLFYLLYNPGLSTFASWTVTYQSPIYDGGCYTDYWDTTTGGGRALRYEQQMSAVTADECRWSCFVQGYIYAGIAWGSQCFCDNELLYNTIAPYQSDCQACSADLSQTCGAVERISVYCNPAIVVCESATNLPPPDTCPDGTPLGLWNNCGECGNSCDSEDKLCSASDSHGECLGFGPAYTIAYTITNGVVPTDLAGPIVV